MAQPTFQEVRKAFDKATRKWCVDCEKTGAVDEDRELGNCPECPVDLVNGVLEPNKGID